MEIGRRVAVRLKDLDEISYIRYASEYRGFTSIEDLASEVSSLQSEPKVAQGQQEFFDAD